VPRILSVANVEMTQARTTQLLRSGGYAVATANDLAEALASYTACRPDGVLIEVDGLYQKPVPILRALRKLDPTARIALVQPGSTDDAATLSEGREATRLLLKPFDPTRWLRAVETLINPPTTRKYVRARTTRSAQITLGSIHADRLACTLEDITPNGARCTLTGTPMPPEFCAGAVVRLAIVLPQGPIHAIARVVHVTGAATVGVVFLRLSPAAHMNLGNYYAELLRNQGHAEVGSAADRCSALVDGTGACIPATRRFALP
jgi:CheY-like chemotaxis protein